MENRLEKIASERGYQVTEEGKVIGIKGNELSSKSVNKAGYNYFALRVNKVRTTLLTHRLQAYQKYGDKLFEEGIMVRHKDGNSLNNSWDNILIGNNSDNQMDIPEQIRIKRSKNATSFVRKYSKERVRNFHNKYKSYERTMKEFNITSKGTLHYILNS